MICCIFSWDIVEAPCGCIRIPTIVGKEDTPQVGSLLPISLSLIFHGCTSNVINYISNSRISARVRMTYFWYSLPSWYNMVKELPNTFADSCLVPASRALYITRESI